jgi:hypothetical protein
MIHRAFVAVTVTAFLLVTVAPAFAAPPQTTGPPASDGAVVASPAASAPGAPEVMPPSETAPIAPDVEPVATRRDWHSPFSVPAHQYTWAPADERSVQLGINFGLLQLAESGFNAAVELRYRRLWLEYSHGLDLTLNNFGSIGMTQTERDQNLHLFVQYTTGFGVGFTILDELWLGVEFKTHHYEVNAPGGPVAGYQTYSIGPVLGYKFFVWRGFFINAYGRYWPNVATSLTNNEIALQGTNGAVEHSAHDFGVFANLAIGGAFDL